MKYPWIAYSEGYPYFWSSMPTPQVRPCRTKCPGGHPPDPPDDDGKDDDEDDDYDDDDDDENDDDGLNCFQRGAFGPRLLKYVCYTTSKQCIYTQVPLLPVCTATTHRNRFFFQVHDDVHDEDDDDEKDGDDEDDDDGGGGDVGLGSMV